jgi:hypothetical protein
VAYEDGSISLLETILPVGNRGTGGQHATSMRENVVSDTLYHRGYLQFDTSGLLPGATVVEANLILHVDHFEYRDVVPPGAVVECGIYAVAEPWSSPPPPGWGWADVPRVITPALASVTFPFGPGGVYTVEVTGLVESWVAGGPNDGLLVGAFPEPDHVGELTAILHGPAASSEILRPRLEVTYYQPTPTPQPTLTVTPTPRPDPTATSVPVPPQPTSPPVPAPTAAQSPTPVPQSILLPASGGERMWNTAFVGALLLLVAVLLGTVGMRRR